LNNEQLIRQFYTSFQNKDYKGMQACYHDKAVFHDPVFKHLNSNEVKAMWEMLCKNGKDLQLSFSDVKADETNGSCRWEAVYTFSKTGKKVHNKITANFKFADNKIIAHTDHFNFWKWSSMALGFPGTLLGWTPFLKGKVSKTALGSLRKFMQQ
jgi:ketosteroid isomerase-like protein